MASHHGDNWCTLMTFQGQELWIQVVSLNDFHNSEKLHNAFLSRSAILNAVLLYMNRKNVHLQSKFQPIALQRKSLLFFSILLVRTVIFLYLFWYFSHFFLQISLDF